MRSFNQFPGTYRRPFDRPGPARNLAGYPGVRRPLGRRVAGFVTRHALAGMAVGAKAGFKHRAKIWPFLAGIGMLAVSYAATWIPDGWKTCLMLAAIVAVVLGWKQWQALKAAETWARSSVLVSWTTWALCAGWTATAAAVGPLTLPVPGFLMAGTVAAQVWWWFHQSIRDTHQAVESDIEQRAERIIDERGETWRTTVAREGGALPDSHLVGVHEVYAETTDSDSDPDAQPERIGWGATIHFQAHDAQTTETAIAAVKRIAKAYRVPTAQVQVEVPIDGMEDTADLLITTKNTLAEPQTFTGPTLDHRTGKFVAGRHADKKPAHWRLWTPNSGVNHGMVAGTTGSGKSGLLMNLCAEIRHSGVGVLLLADPENGESVRDWQLGANCFAGTVPRIRRMLQGAERVYKSRKRRRAGYWTDEQGRERRGKGFFNPTREDPGVWVVIDEAPDVLADPECRRIIALLGKKGRKFGVGVVIFVQIPSLAELGGDMAVRSMLSSTNIVIFRTSDSMSAQMGAPMSLPVNPVKFPAEWPDGSITAGYGVLVKVGGRVSPMRASWQDDPYHWATTGDPAELTGEDLAAFADEDGNYYLQWMDLLDVDDEDDDEETTATPNTGGYVVQIKRGSREKVLAFLRSRPNAQRPSVIADNTGMSRPGVSMLLGRMVKDGVVIKTLNSEYDLPPAEREQLAMQDELATNGVA